MRARVRLCHIATCVCQVPWRVPRDPRKDRGLVRVHPRSHRRRLSSSVAAAGLSRNRGRIEGLCAALSCLNRAGARLCRHLPRNYQRVLDCSGSTPGPADGPITSRSWPLPGLSTALARLGTAQVPRSKPCRLTLLSAALRSKMPLPTDDRSRHAPNDRHPVNASFANGDQQVRSNSAVETCLACPVRPTTRMDPRST